MSQISIIFLCFATIVSRIWLSDNVDVVTLMAGINTVALLIVIAALFEKTNSNLNDMLSSYNASFVAKGKKAHAIKIRNIVLGIVFILSCIYFIVWKNAIVNDILSVFSLAISIVTDTVADFLAQQFNKKT